MRRPIIFLLIPLAGLTLVRAQEFRVQTRLDAQAKMFPDGKQWFASVVDTHGAVRYTIQREVAYGSPFPALAVSSDEGWGICLDAFEGTVDFIDSTGTPVRSWRPFGDDPPDHERILKCSVARGSAAVLWSMPDERGAFAALFSARGELIWDRRLAEVVGGEVQISENESYVLASSYTFRGPPRFATELFGVAGERLAFHPRIFRSACVPESEGNAPPVFVLTDGKVLTHHSADQKTKGVDIWTAPAPDDVITDVTMQPDGTIFALVQKVTAGEDGIQYGQGRLLTTRGPAGAPAIRLIRVPGEGQLSFLRTGDRLQIRSETSATPLPLDAIE